MNWNKKQVKCIAKLYKIIVAVCIHVYTATYTNIKFNAF